MPAPSTAVLDTFNRANGALGANWATLNGSVMLDVANNRIKAAGTFRTARWVTSFAADQEAHMTRSVLGAAGRMYLHLRVQNPGASFNSYSCRFGSTGGYTASQLEKNVSGVNSNIGSQTNLPSFAAGDKIAMQAEGTTIRVYHDAGSGWVEIWSVVDASVTGAGCIGVQFARTDHEADDFSGGALGGGGTTHNLQATYTRTRSEAAALIVEKPLSAVFARTRTVASILTVVKPLAATFSRTRTEAAALAVVKTLSANFVRFRTFDARLEAGVATSIKQIRMMLGLGQ